MSHKSNKSNNAQNTKREEISFQDIMKHAFQKSYYNENNKASFSRIPTHENVVCDSCKRTNFSLDRYRCLICKDYDLCGDCFEDRNISKPHSKGHPMVRYSDPNEIFGESVKGIKVNLDTMKHMFKNAEHSPDSCSICGVKPIIGVRFKCDECLDFELCFSCYEKNPEKGNHRKDHALLVANCLINFEPDELEFLNKLGSGAFGTVVKAKWLTKNKIVACKVLQYNLFHLLQGFSIEKFVESYARELTAYNEFNCNFIIKVFGSCIDKENTTFYLLTEFMERGSLTDVIGKDKDLSYRCRLLMACNIASGMRRIHLKNFIHRDIRPDNVFVSENYVAKIGDMGIAKLQDQARASTHSLMGCMPYMPKEFYTGKYSEKLDIFTFGLTLYYLFTGVNHKFENNVISLPEEPIVFGGLINRCLSEKPDDRPSAAYLEEILKVYYQVLWSFISSNPEYDSYDADKRREIFFDNHWYATEKLKNKGMFS